MAVARPGLRNTGPFALPPLDGILSVFVPPVERVRPGAKTKPAVAPKALRKPKLSVNIAAAATTTTTTASAASASAAAAAVPPLTGFRAPDFGAALSGGVGRAGDDVMTALATALVTVVGAGPGAELDSRSVASAADSLAAASATFADPSDGGGDYECEDRPKKSVLFRPKAPPIMPDRNVHKASAAVSRPQSPLA